MPAVQYKVEELRGRPLGRVLVKMGKVTRDQVHEALAIQKEKGGPIGQILVDLSYVEDKTRNLALIWPEKSTSASTKKAPTRNATCRTAPHSPP